ncbi:MAG: hypothetical protein L0L39_04000 [Atopostipes suicloacalis]|nr:hypothetical protein [Atopostipes suicloacalis]MDN6731326.1 hypothetical protein [Atopostipes suicloacalis]
MEKGMWQCDECGKAIKSADKGWLKWTKNHNDGSISHFKIIHHPKCDEPGPKIRKTYRATPGDLLSDFVGTNGLVRLLELIPQTHSKDQKGLLEVIQRLHIPGYESARPYFNEAYEDKKIIPPVEGVYYLTLEKLQAIFQEYGKQDEK